MVRERFSREPLVALLGVLLWVGTSSAVDLAAGGQRPRSPSGAGTIDRVVVRTGSELTVSWSARGRAPGGRFRLYRAANTSGLQLVGELEVVLGEHTYRIEDLPGTAGTVVYRLCYSSGSASEATLGTILCLEPRFESRSTATTSAPDLCALVPTLGQPPPPESNTLWTLRSGSARGSRPEPERPPPRSMSV
jgi:hypothetical protein